MSRNILTVFQNKSFEIKDFTKFYVLEMSDGRIYKINKRNYEFEPPLEDMRTQTRIIEIIERKKQRGRNIDTRRRKRDWS